MAREKLVIETSTDPENPNKYRVKLHFDDPKQYENESRYGEGMYTAYNYLVTHEGEEVMLRAYTGLFNAINKVGAIRDTVIDIFSLGEDKEKRWYCNYISGPVRRADEPVNPVQEAQSPTSVGGDWAKLADPGDVEVAAKLFLAQGQIELIGYSLGLVNADILYNSISEEGKLHVAMSGAAYANRMYRTGMLPPGYDKPNDLATSSEMQLLDSLDMSDLTKFARSLIALPLDLTTGEITDMMKAFGIKSADMYNAMKEDDTRDTLRAIRALELLKEMTSDGQFGKVEAYTKIAEQYGYEYEAPAEEDDLPF